jgi:cytochrome c-type biogenesis protein CcmH
MNDMRVKNYFFYSLALMLFLIIFLPSIDVFAQEPTPSDDEVNAIARQLYCPVCENTPLDVCPTTACHQWRELIRQMLSEGKSETEIKQYFVEYYGARVLSEPPPTGINWLAYLVPPAAFLIGGYLLFRAFKIWRHMAVNTQADDSLAIPNDQETSLKGIPGTPDSDTYVTRLEEELEKRK